MHVVDDHRMVRTENRAEARAALAATPDAFLVEVVPEEIDAVRARKVISCIAVEVRERGPGGRGGKDARAEMLAHEAAVLERDLVRARELEIGDVVEDLSGEPRRLRESRGVQRREPHETGTPPPNHFFRRAVRAEERRLVVLVERDETRDLSCDARVPGQRGMFGAREREP